MNTTNPEMDERYLLTEGVTSTVSRRRYGIERESGLGHIALFDWDEHVEPEDAIEFSRDGLQGPTLIFESSEGSYHGWNLKVRNYAKTVETLEDYRDDHKHIAVGKDRGWWRLRIGEKRKIRDDVYKPAPEYVGTALGEPTGYRSRVSDPHLELARVCGVPEDEINRIRNMYRPVGDEIEVVSYVTMTDVEKHIRRQVTDE